MSDLSLTVDPASLLNLHKLFGYVTDKQGAAAFRKGARAGAKLLVPEIKQMTPTKTGKLRSSIRVRAIKRSRKSIGVQVTLGKGFFQGETFYGGFLEFGHYIGARRAKAFGHFGNFRKRVEGKWFMRTAAKGMEGAVKRVAIARMIFELEQLYRKFYGAGATY